MHGGVDGYTRLPVYLRAGTNNTAATVLGLFQQAVAEYGLPGLGLTGEVRMLMCLCTCFNTHSGVLGEEV